MKKQKKTRKLTNRYEGDMVKGFVYICIHRESDATPEKQRHEDHAKKTC